MSFFTSPYRFLLTILFSLLLLMGISCSESISTPTAEEHEQEILNWHKDRIQRLLARQGWVAGCFGQVPGFFENILLRPFER